MRKEDEKYESLKAKLRKLAILAERGVDGEAENARILMERICREHGVSLEEILNVEERKRYRFEIGRHKIDLSIFAQCYAKVTGEKGMPYFRESRSVISAEMTAYQYAEISSLFEWHKANFQREVESQMDILFQAYCSKHRLFSERSGDDADEELNLSPEDIRRLLAIQALKGCLNDNTYCKLIGR